MLITALWISATVYGGLLLLVFMGQHRLVFMATRELYRTPASNGWQYDDVRLEVEGERTHGWYVHAETDPRGVILFSHGNAGNIADRLESISIFRDLGFDVLAYDYGGYGESTGRPSEDRCYADIRAMWRYLIDERGIVASRIVLFGRSLGAGPTCQLATEVEAAAVILESTFTSIPDRAQEMYRIFPARLILRIRFDNAEKISTVRSPLLVVHSPDDTLIPIHHGRALFERAPEPKSFLEIRGDHNEGFWSSGRLYTDGLTAFLDPLIAPEPSTTP
ncbi:MAG: alpha/beta hydrolase [Candidatus Hydrogenedentes bacterium]|nr:alpha/beta hydrolase [Candidatus Hydrogenedentota bacterium]